jgi:hypothetical protein
VCVCLSVCVCVYARARVCGIHNILMLVSTQNLHINIAGYEAANVTMKKTVMAGKIKSSSIFFLSCLNVV